MERPLAFLEVASFDLDMDFKLLKLLLLFAVAIVQVGCATANESSDDSTPVLEPAPSHDDSHGWGANLQSEAH
jgi:hypothetical protein